jgi:hypothetical protein
MQMGVQRDERVHQLLLSPAWTVKPNVLCRLPKNSAIIYVLEV